MKMRYLLSALLVLCLAVTLSSCGKKGGPNAGKSLSPPTKAAPDSTSK